MYCSLTKKGTHYIVLRWGWADICNIITFYHEKVPMFTLSHIIILAHVTETVHGMYSKMHLTGQNRFTNSFSGGYKTTQGWFVVDKITVRF